MSKQERKQIRRSKPKDEVEQKTSSGSAGGQDGKTQDILDAIDETIEEMGQDFAESYVQRGGQ